MLIKAKKHSVLFGIVLILIYCSLYFIKGENSYLESSDSLDSVVVWYKLIESQNAHFWENSKLVEGMIGAQPRHVYPSEFDPILWIYTFFPTFYAFSLNFLLVHLFAFLSMYFLLKEVLPQIKVISNYNFDGAIGGVLFGLIPFWTHAGLSSAGLPLVLLSFLKINKGEYKAGIALMLCFTFYSSLIISGIFVLFVYVTSLFVLLLFKRLDISRLKLHLINLSLSSLIYLIANYRLILSVLFSDFESHRTQFQLANINLNIVGSLYKVMMTKVFYTQWHAGPILPVISISIVFLSGFYFLKKNTASTLRAFILLLIFLVMLTVLMGNEKVIHLLSSVPIVSAIQLQRFYILLPFIMTLNFILFLYTWRLPNILKLVLMMIAIPLYFSIDPNWNRSLGINKDLLIPNSKFSDYYQQDEYEQIKNKLLLDYNERVVSLGLDPAAAVYNGIPSADGYLANYALESKVNMFEIIQNELEQDNKLKKYFVDWGSRCYFFNSIYGKNVNFSAEVDTIDSFKYDIPAMLENNIKYIISNAMIKDNIENISLYYQSDRIYVYEVKK